jgi:hypothetical protein
MHGSKEPNNTLNAYLRTTIRSLGLLTKLVQDIIHHDYLLQITREGVTRKKEYIKGESNESELQLRTPSGTGCHRRSS